jgi:hypothetical protein
MMDDVKEARKGRRVSTVSGNTTLGSMFDTMALSPVFSFEH